MFLIWKWNTWRWYYQNGCLVHFWVLQQLFFNINSTPKRHVSYLGLSGYYPTCSLLCSLLLMSLSGQCILPNAVLSTFNCDSFCIISGECLWDLFFVLMFQQARFSLLSSWVGTVSDLEKVFLSLVRNLLAIACHLDCRETNFVCITFCRASSLVFRDGCPDLSLDLHLALQCLALLTGAVEYTDCTSAEG